MLAKEQLYEVINQLMPQIQSNLTKKIHEQYQQQIQNMHIQYQKRMLQINHNHNIKIQSLKNKYQLKIQQSNTDLSKTTEIQLRKQLSALQRQRVIWLKQQEQYRKLITKLIYNNNNKATQQIHLNPINLLKNCQKQQISSQYTPKYQNDIKNNQKQSQNDSIYNQKSAQKAQKKDEQTLNKYLLKQNEKSQSKQQLKKQELKKKQNNTKFNHNLKTELDKQNHFTSILSPPKDQRDKSSQKVTKKLFWNNQMKSKLLNLIKIAK